MPLGDSQEERDLFTRKFGVKVHENYDAGSTDDLCFVCGGRLGAHKWNGSCPSDVKPRQVGHDELRSAITEMKSIVRNLCQS